MVLYIFIAESRDPASSTRNPCDLILAGPAAHSETFASPSGERWALLRAPWFSHSPPIPTPFLPSPPLVDDCISRRRSAKFVLKMSLFHLKTSALIHHILHFYPRMRSEFFTPSLSLPQVPCAFIKSYSTCSYTSAYGYFQAISFLAFSFKVNYFPWRPTFSKSMYFCLLTGYTKLCALLSGCSPTFSDCLVTKALRKRKKEWPRYPQMLAVRVRLPPLV